MDDNRAGFVPAGIAKKIAAIPRARKIGLADCPVVRSKFRRPLAAVWAGERVEPDDRIEAVRRDVIVIRRNQFQVLKFPRG